MKAFPLLALFSLASALCFADSWTGKLVDATCVDQAQGKAANCMPTAKTAAFALDTGDGKVFRLDAAGNAKAVTMLKSGVKSETVVISGAMNGETVKVESITTQ